MTLTFAVIGTGAMGLEHIRNLKLVEGVKVIAVADSNSAQRDEAAALLDKDAKILDDYKALREIEGLDVLVIATPNYHHIEILREVVPWKRHLLVEKPLCTTIQDCYEVRDLVAEHMPQAEVPNGGPVFWVGMEYRYMPPIAKLLDVVDGGALGQIHMVHIREHRFPFLLKIDNWNRFSANTGGTLVEKCCHFWDLMRRILRNQGNRVCLQSHLNLTLVRRSTPGSQSQDRSRGLVSTCFSAFAPSLTRPSFTPFLDLVENQNTPW